MFYCALLGSIQFSLCAAPKPQWQLLQPLHPQYNGQTLHLSFCSLCVMGYYATFIISYKTKQSGLLLKCNRKYYEEDDILTT